jgi:predicted Zn-dependent peptidase
MSMLDEGTKTLDSLGIADRAESLGADLAAGSSLDSSYAAVSALTERLDESLQLFADVVRNPQFPQGEVDRVRKEWIAAIAREKTNPEALAYRVLPPLLYGDAHPYAIPFSGSGTEASIGSLTRDDLVAFHGDWIRPDNATLIVTGDVSAATLLPLLEKHFGDWVAPASARPAKSIPPAARTVAPRVFLIDKPGAIEQHSRGTSNRARHGTQPARDRDDERRARRGFTSRISMNLREGKLVLVRIPACRMRWASGHGSCPRRSSPTGRSTRSARYDGRVAGSWVTPASAEEIAKVRNRDVRALPAVETNAAVSGAIAEMLTFKRPDDYVRTLKSRIEAQTDEGVRSAAAESLDPARMTWVVIGDLAKIEQPIRDLKIGEVSVLDADGGVLR